MKYFNPDTKGRNVLAAIKSIQTHEERIKFIQEYQVHLCSQEGNPKYDKRVIERTIYYMFGFMCGTEGSSSNQITEWKKAINEILYPEEPCEVKEHRLLQTGD